MLSAEEFAKLREAPPGRMPIHKQYPRRTCCDHAEERHYRRGYYQGYKYGLHLLFRFVSETTRAELKQYLKKLLDWSVRGQLPDVWRKPLIDRLPPKAPVLTQEIASPKVSRPPVVYILLAEGTTRIKIGYSTNPQGRLDGLRSGSPFPLRVLREIPTADPATLERLLHMRYAAHRQHGEWFELPLETLGALIVEPFHKLV
jgi:hypothetical protein